MSGDEFVDRGLFPFRSRYVDVGPGRLHVVDEGSGPAVLLVHGTPTWSFLYRRLIADLARDHRVVAADHLGFGLSDRPERWSGRPQDHARNLEVLIERLGLADVVLVVHDYGGPIGLSWALAHAGDVRGLVLFNTWMWSLAGTRAERTSRLLSGPLGRFLYERLNVSPRLLVPAAFGDRRTLTPEVHRHYVDAFPTPAERRGPYVLARELAASGDWYRSLWRRRERIADKPALVLWGLRDPAFGSEALERWRATLTRAHFVVFPDAGHFVPEEAPEPVGREVRRFLAGLDSGASADRPRPLPPDGAGIRRSGAADG